MRVFKHCRSAHVDLIRLGSLRFSSLAYFRHIEMDDDDSLIGDKQEGQSEGVLESFHVDKNPSDEDIELLKNCGIHISKQSEDITVTDSHVIFDSGHWLIFSLSASGDPLSGVSGYDACVEFSDVNALFERIVRTGAVGGIPVAEIFDLDASVCGPVEYTPRTASVRRTEQLVAANPLAKRPKYEEQREFRIALKAQNRWLPDIQDIEADIPIVRRPHAVPHREAESFLP